ncbi:hypothetical protein KC19_6G159800 [Ceratodon purpureus]|uniref:Uncharacterized protein n=1 Tax=Ceratodon purpureus TaxID=3225 RepID=A0A8T0HF47_CERPU|nr:hypothetical protein KC19_6G159800 [Ceratodon purpureus]
MMQRRNCRIIIFWQRLTQCGSSTWWHKQKYLPIHRNVAVPVESLMMSTEKVLAMEVGRMWKMQVGMMWLMLEQDQIRLTLKDGIKLQGKLIGKFSSWLSAQQWILIDLDTLNQTVY